MFSTILSNPQVAVCWAVEGALIIGLLVVIWELRKK